MSETPAGKLRTAGQTTVTYAPGTRVRVTQQIPQRDDAYATTVEGTVLRQERQGSGSWYDRNYHGKVWLDRLIITKDDGEMSILNLDKYSRVEVLSGPNPTPGTGPLVLPNVEPMGSIN